MNRFNKQQVENSERFYRLPKALFTNDFYKKMKPETKLAYAIFKDRFELSIQNNWVDDQGDVYLLFSVKKMQEILGFSNKKVIAIKKELTEYELIEEERQGLNKANRIYVGAIKTEKEVIHKADPLGDKEVNNLHFRKCNSDTSRSVDYTRQEVNKIHSNDTDYSETNLSDTEINNSFDDEDDINNASREIQKDNATDSSKAIILCGELLQQHQLLRPIVLNAFGDLLVENPTIMANIIQTLITNYQHLESLAKFGNTKLTNLIAVHGQKQGILFLLEQATQQQLEFMQSHLINAEYFDQYFAKGLASRITVLTTIPNTNLVY
ncbi:UNVERIFIED_ORG: hypothetical protein ABIC58_000011 [Leuconostoc holzapfelii]